MTDEHRRLLKSRLKANRWTLYHLATHSGITQGYLSRMIHNRLDASQPIKIALALHASEMTGFPYNPSDFDITTTTTEN
jgi:transcriptional regulator with XRE-family HTH domain